MSYTPRPSGDYNLLEILRFDPEILANAPNLTLSGGNIPGTDVPYWFNRLNTWSNRCNKSQLVLPVSYTTYNQCGETDFFVRSGSFQLNEVDECSKIVPVLGGSFTVRTPVLNGTPTNVQDAANIIAAMLAGSAPIA